MWIFRFLCGLLGHRWVLLYEGIEGRYQECRLCGATKIEHYHFKGQ